MHKDVQKKEKCTKVIFEYRNLHKISKFQKIQK